MKILVATKNKGKIEGTRKAFSHYYSDIEINGIPVSSDVSDEPVGEEIMLGAKNRLKNLRAYCQENSIDADMYVSIESGIYNSLGSYMITNLAVIEDNEGTVSVGTSASFPVPNHLAKEIIDTDLSLVMDKVFGEDKERHNSYGGIQLLTKNVITRIDLTEQACVMALTKFLNPEWRDR